MIKRALIISLVFHALLIAVLSSGFSFARKQEVAISARLVFKTKKKNKDLLPKKPKETKEQALKEKQEVKLEKNSQDLAKSLAPLVKEKAVKAEPKKTENYANTLAALSKSFAKDISASEEESEDEGGEDYFDQIYTLLKSSFVIPPHLNGPKGERLQVVVRIFVAKDGRINKLDLEKSSGDDHFDKAVMDGARRVNNFGPVPIVLQDTLRERGLVVELCPFKCLNSR